MQVRRAHGSAVPEGGTGRQLHASHLGAFLPAISNRLDIERDFDLEVTAYRHDFDRTWFKLNGFQEGTPLEEILANPDSGRRAILYELLPGEQDSTTEGETLLHPRGLGDFRVLVARSG